MISESIDLKQLGGKITQITNDMIFAGVVALNRVAWMSRRAVQENMPDVFTIRSKWILKGVRVKQATKQDQEAAVYNKDWYMMGHEEGDRRTLSDVPGGIPSIVPGTKSSFWVPVGIREAAGVDNSKRIPASLRPQNILKGKKKLYGNKPFLILKGKSRIAVRKRATQYPLKILYQAETTLSFSKREWFEDTISKTYDKHIEREYEKAVMDVLSGAIGGKKK